MPVPGGGEVLLLLGSSGAGDVPAHTLGEYDTGGVHVIVQTACCYNGPGLGCGLGLVALQLRPGIGLDVVLVKVVLPIHAIIPPENVDIVLERHACMKGPLRNVEHLKMFTGQGMGPCEWSSYQHQLSWNFSRVELSLGHLLLGFSILSILFFIN